MKTKIILTFSVLLVVFMVGSVADYVYAYDGSTNCRLRWGEAVGIGCKVPAELITVAEVITKELPVAEGAMQCRSRWGEPSGTGCRVPIKEVTAAKEIAPQEVPAAYKVPTYRTRWGEPIGVGYR